MSMESYDFIAIAKEHAIKTMNIATNSSIDLKDFEIQEEEKLTELKEVFDKQAITQEEYDAQRTAITEKKKVMVKKWRSILQDSEDDIFNEILPKFERILTIDEDNCTLPLSNDKILTIPSDYTPKEMNAINKLLKEFQEVATDDMKAVDSIAKARSKCIELNLNITLDGEALNKFVDLDIQDTKFKKLPLVIALLPQIIHAMHYICKYNQLELLKKK
jgi:hypothetical protein